ncbi:unnamed protein product [Amaranthus hypochondriacus]
MIIIIIPSSILTLLLLTNTVESTNLINQTCKISSMSDPNINFDFCIDAFHKSPSSFDANLNRLGLISINLVKHNVNDTIIFAKTLLENFRGDNFTREGLEDCVEVYEDSFVTLYESARDYRGARFNDANIKVSSVIDASSTCEDGFGDFGVVSPLTKQNNHTFQLCAISLSIIDMLMY